MINGRIYCSATLFLDTYIYIHIHIYIYTYIYIYFNFTPQCLEESGLPGSSGDPPVFFFDGLDG